MKNRDWIEMRFDGHIIRLAPFIFVAALVFGGTDRAEAVDVHKLLEWKMDESSGGIAFDTAGVNNGFLAGNAAFVSGWSGNCLEFGSSAYVCNTSATNLPTGAGDAWTINMFIRPDATPSDWAVIGGFGNLYDGVSRGSRYIIYGGTINFWGHWLDIYSTGDFEVGVWQMVTATYDGSVIRLYKDAGPIASQYASLAMAASRVYLAPSKWGGNFTGKIDEFTIWDRALSPAEIDALQQTSAKVYVTATDPYPPDGAAAVHSAVVLNWDAPADVLNPTYNVYFSEDSNDLSPVESSLTATSFNPSPPGCTLSCATDFYWRIDVEDPNIIGEPVVHTGEVWSFRTAGQSRNPVPSDNATGVNPGTTLSWDEPGSCVESPLYSVYFGTDARVLSLIAAGQTTRELALAAEDMHFLTDYFWRVDVTDGENTYTGELWTFRTRFHILPWGWGENGSLVIEDCFDTLSDDWREIYMQGTGSGGGAVASDGRMHLSVAGSNKIYGLYNLTSFAGHFCAEIDFASDDFSGLALIQKNGDLPDANNFTSIHVTRNSQNKVVVSIRDRQAGTDDVLDNTGIVNLSSVMFGQKRYEHLLDGSNTYSVPYTSTNKRFRICRDGPAGFFHFYYAVKAYIHGQWADGWMELAPSRDWSISGNEFYVAPYVFSGNRVAATAIFDNLKVMRKPTQDQDDSNTGFKVTRREYNWSGFSGDAVVISFGDDFEYDKDCKFVFWSENNYVPAWHLNNQLQYSYEFLETWGGGSVGCHEPMSDRILRWSDVEVIEDNDVRKAVHWHYVLADPDYKTPDDGIGVQLPEADEYWTFYPDGTGVRRIRYTPKLDTDFRNWHEITEVIAIAGSLSNPRDHHSYPALTVLNLDGNVDDYHPDPYNSGPWNADTANWSQIITATHFHSAPDAFSAFSQAPDIPQTYAFYPLNPDISWHCAQYEFAHWPVGKEPFYSDTFKSHGTWSAQVSSNGLMGIGIQGGTGWSSHYLIDERGRRYREWASLVGLNPPRDNNALKDKTRTWLYPGTVTMLGPDSVFDSLDYMQKEIVFRNTGDQPRCNFLLEPDYTTLNPTFRINNWPRCSAKIFLDGRRLSRGNDFYWACRRGQLIVWVKGRFDSPTTFDISACPDGDIDGDCDVDFEDLRDFVANWLTADDVSDFDCSTMADLSDFAALAQTWLYGKP
ncbi:MAG: LamG domain-containing protein [Sedimentisphaerales bacterium]|nr:LamG domain-containing protein [Sedimentisphaerales bacterium]